MEKFGSGRASPRRVRYFWLAACPVVAGVIALAVSVFGQTVASATATVGLGTAGNYAVLASSTVTNTGPSVLNGDLGLSPGPSTTGFGGAPNGTVNGATNVDNAAAVQAQLDLTTAYNEAASASTTADIPATIGSAGIDTATLVPGVYTASTTLGVEGALTLNAEGNPDATWIFQVGSALRTATYSSVVFINDPAPLADQACNLFWQVGSSATIQTGSDFAGTIMAYASVTVDANATISGRALASTAAVTLIDDTITTPGCDTTVTPPSTSPPSTSPPSTSPPSTSPPSTSPPSTSPPSTSPPSTGLPTFPRPTPSTASPTSPATHPAPSPTSPASTKPKPKPKAKTKPKTATAPKPVSTTFPVTG